MNAIRPKFFVFENVTGLLTARLKGEKNIFTVLGELGKEYKVYQGNPSDMVFNTVNFGVPQIRKRVIIFGVRKDIDIEPEELYNGMVKTNWDNDMPVEERKGLLPPITVREAIGDLPPIPNGGGSNLMEFKPKVMNSFVSKIRSKEDDTLLYHVTRKNNDKDKERYMVMAKNHWTFLGILDKSPELVPIKQGFQTVAKIRIDIHGTIVS